MSWIMIGNAIIEVAWIVATVVLILHGYWGWAVVTFIAAFISGYRGYSVKKKQ